MKKTLKKSLALLLAALMVISIMPTFAITAFAADKWFAVASNDLSDSHWSWNDSRHNDGAWGWAMEAFTNGDDQNDNDWKSEQYYDWGDLDNGHIGNGYLYINESQTPVTGLAGFKIDIQFKFTDDFEITGANDADFLILTTENDCSWLGGDNRAPRNNFVFKQNGNGAITIGGTTYDSKTSTDYRIATNNSNIGKNNDCHYILEYKDNTVKAYVTNASGDTVIDYGSFNETIDTSAIKNMIVGVTNRNDFSYNYQNITYSNINFYRAADTYTVNFKTSDGTSTIESRTVNEGDALGALPTNTATAPTDDTHHNVYTWEGVSASTVVTQDTDYNETETETACTWNGGVHSGDRTTYTCTACGNSYYVLDTYTVDFYNAENVKIDTKNITAGDPLGTLPANTAIVATDSTHHNVYTWEGITAETVVTGDTDYTETATEIGCEWGEGVHTAASGDANGYTTYTCTACTNSYVSYDAQDFTAYASAYKDYTDTITSPDYTGDYYTADSKAAFEAAMALITDLPLDTTDKTISQDKIDATATAINDALALLVADIPNNTYNLDIDENVNVEFDIDTQFYAEKQNATQVRVSYITTTDDKKADRTEETIAFADLDDSEDNVRKEIVLVAAPAQIAEKYTVEILDAGENVVDSFETSIEEYCQTILDGNYEEEDKNYAQALLNYGALANEYFGYAALSKAVTGNDYTVKHSDDYKDDVDASTFVTRAKASLTNGVDASGKKVKINSVSYVALIDPEFRFYIDQDNEVYAAMTDVEVLEGNVSAEMIKTEKGFCVSVTGLKATDFAKIFKIRIGTAELTYNGYAYLYTTLASSNTSSALKDLAKGIYRYAVAAEAKFTQNQEG